MENKIKIYGITGHMPDREKVELVQDAIKSWREGKLSAESAMIAIDAFFNPVPLTDEDVKWAEEVIRENHLE